VSFVPLIAALDVIESASLVITIHPMTFFQFLFLINADQVFRFALDLVEVFFQIVHTRIPLLNPAQFRSRLRLYPTNSNSNSNEKPLHPALVATVLAWGSKFSEHPLLLADRRRHGGQSRLAKALIDRARDLAEALKVHRVASTEHVVIGLLIEPLQSRQYHRLYFDNVHS